MKHLLIALCLIVSSINSHACNCAFIVGFEGADVVFTGRVKNIKEVEDTSSSNYVQPAYEITFEVHKIDKGDPNVQTLVVNTSRGNCSPGFMINQDYRVFALRSKKGLVTSKCTKTALLKK